MDKRGLTWFLKIEASRALADSLVKAYDLGAANGVEGSMRLRLPLSHRMDADIKEVCRFTEWIYGMLGYTVIEHKDVRLPDDASMTFRDQPAISYVFARPAPESESTK